MPLLLLEAKNCNRKAGNSHRLDFPVCKVQAHGLDDFHRILLLTDSRKLIFLLQYEPDIFSHSALCFGYRYYFWSFSLFKNILNYQIKVPTFITTQYHYLGKYILFYFVWILTSIPYFNLDRNIIIVYGIGFYKYQPPSTFVRW